MHTNEFQVPLQYSILDNHESYQLEHAENLEIVEIVRLKNKLILEPHAHKWLTFSTHYLSPNKLYCFQSEVKSKHLICYDLLLGNDVGSSEQESSEHESNMKADTQFYVYIKNISNKLIHLNKNSKVGTIYEVHDVIESSTSRDFKSKMDFAENKDRFHMKSNENLSQFVLNYIHASDEILKKRKEELSINDFNLTHLNDMEAKILGKLLLTYYSSFSKSMKTLGHTDRVVPNLKFTNDFPIKTLPFPIPQALHQETKDQLQQLLDAGIIERNCSEWACPILLVKKKLDATGKQKYRLALDLRMLNSVLQGSSYPLPKIQTIISNLSSYKFFTSLDFQNAYHQIDLPEKFQDQLTFTCMYGTFKYKRLVFGLKSSAGYFQNLMDLLIDELQLEGVFAYQDDLIFGSNSFEESCQKLQKILQILTKYNLTLSPNKCTFHKESVDYLGFHIENHCISPIHSNIVKINSFPPPTTKRQLKKFIGLVTFYKSLIPSFSELIQPLINLTRPKCTFHWTDKHQKLFDKMQQVFFQSPMVRLPDWSKTFFVNTDASKIAIAGALLQEYEGQLLPIAYYSKSLKPSEKKYPALKLELMAIYRSVQAFKYYLYNRKFVILSDSAPLKKYKKTTNPADITTRWLTELSEYTYTFEHIPGSSNVLADYLSRCDFAQHQQTLTSNPELLNSSQVLPIVDNDISNNDNENTVNKQYLVNYLITGNTANKDPLLEISNETFVSEQKKDPHLSVIYKEILKKGSSRKFPTYFIHPDSKVLMLKKENIIENTFSYHIIVPNSLKAKVLTICHLSHFGLTKTYEFLTSTYFWKGMYADALNFVASCRKCLQIKHHRTPPAPLQPTYTPTHPGHTISVDLVGPFTNGQSVLTVIDHFSRHMELFPLKDTSTSKIVNCLFNYITTFGRPSVVLSDLGPQFTSHVYNVFHDTLGIKILHSSVSHPQSNSISERINKSIKYSVYTLLQEGHKFENALLIHKSLYNGSRHSSTNFSPNLLHFGRELSLIFDTFDHYVNQPFLDKNFEVYKLLQDLDSIYKKAYINIKNAQTKRNDYYQRRAKLRDIFVKDIVYLRSVDKFKPKFMGPYIVVYKHSPVSVSIKRLHSPDESSFRVHIDRLIIAPPRNDHLFLSHDSNFNKDNQNITSRYNLRPRK